MTDQELDELLRESTEASGVPYYVEDPLVLHRLARRIRTKKEGAQTTAA